MRYYRCECGNRQAWSSMGVSPCVSCDECGTTLAEGPNGHREPESHDWRHRWTNRDGDPVLLVECRRCHHEDGAYPLPPDVTRAEHEAGHPLPEQPAEAEEGES